MVPGPDRVPPGQQRRAGRRALYLRCVVGQPEPPPGERVDPPGPRAPERPAAVAAQLPEPQVIDVEEQDVRPVGHFNLTFLYGVPPSPLAAR
jgi:hypothetical protein